jgi:hypothetical protein
MITTYRRAPAFGSLDDILDWSERHGTAAPAVERGPDGTYRGSLVEESDDNEREDPSS